MVQKDEKYKKKFECNGLWMDSKLYVDQGYVNRPILKRFL